MDRRILVALVLAAACAASESPATSNASADTTAGRAPTDAATPPGAAGAPDGARAPSTATAGPSAPNPTGRIPVLEYHVIGGDKNTLYTRTLASYRADLEEAYRLGYRPVTISQVLDKDWRDVPKGMAPVVVVFDDASDSQFRYLEQNGKLVIDPTSAVGTWLEFGKTHPGWKNRAVFCMLNGGAAGHNFFGDKPQYGGQKKEWRFQKVKWLADQGFELCAHTLWHAKLNKYPDAVVQEQIARNAMGIDSAVPGYKIRTFALPYGLWPKNRQLAWQGSWTDPKTKQVHPYRFDAVLEVAGGPARSPYDPQFNPRSINRIEAVGDDVRRQLNQLVKNGTRFVPEKR